MITRRGLLVSSCAALLLAACAAPREERAVAIPIAPDPYEPLAVVLVPDFAAATEPSPEIAATFANLELAVLRRVEYASDRSGWFRIRRRPGPREASTATGDPLAELPPSIDCALVVGVDHFVVVDEGHSGFSYGSEDEHDVHYESGARGVRCQITLALWRRDGEDWVSVSQGTGKVDTVADRHDLDVQGLFALFGGDEREKDAAFVFDPGSKDLGGASVQHVLDETLARALADMVAGGLETAVAEMRAAPVDSEDAPETVARP